MGFEFSRLPPELTVELDPGPFLLVYYGPGLEAGIDQLLQGLTEPNLTIGRTNLEEQTSVQTRRSNWRHNAQCFVSNQLAEQLGGAPEVWGEFNLDSGPRHTTTNELLRHSTEMGRYFNDDPSLEWEHFQNTIVEHPGNGRAVRIVSAVDITNTFLVLPVPCGNETVPLRA